MEHGLNPCWHFPFGLAVALALATWCPNTRADSGGFEALLAEAGWAERISGDGTGSLLGLAGEDACLEPIGRDDCEATRIWPKSDPAVVRIVAQPGWVIPALGGSPAEVWIDRLPYGVAEPVIPRFGGAEGEGPIAVQLPARAVVSPGPTSVVLVGAVSALHLPEEVGRRAWVDLEVRGVDAQGLGQAVVVWRQEEPAVVHGVVPLDPQKRERSAAFLSTVWAWCVEPPKPAGEADRWAVVRTEDDGVLAGVAFAGLEDLSSDARTCLEINGWRLEVHLEESSRVAFFRLGQRR